MSMESTLQHIAIIPDGNRTWAKNNGLASHKGHEEWYSRTKEILEYAFENINSLVGITLWALSTDNMKKRSEKEKSFLFSLLERGLKELEPILIKHNIWFIRLWSREGVSKTLLEKLDDLQNRLAHLKDKTLNLLFNYGGHRHIQDAFEKAKSAWKDTIASYMTLWNLPPVDLIIRTKWVHRTSWFLPREAYAERHFSDLMYPDFTTNQLDIVVQDWYSRKRNYWA